MDSEKPRLTRPRGVKLKAPLIGASSYSTGPTWYVRFVLIDSVGSRLMINQGYYKKEFLKENEPFTVSKEEFELHLRHTGKFREVK